MSKVSLSFIFEGLKVVLGLFFFVVGRCWFWFIFFKRGVFVKDVRSILELAFRGEGM